MGRAEQFHECGVPQRSFADMDRPGACGVARMGTLGCGSCLAEPSRPFWGPRSYLFFSEFLKLWICLRAVGHFVCPDESTFLFFSLAPESACGVLWGLGSFVCQFPTRAAVQRVRKLSARLVQIDREADL